MRRRRVHARAIEFTVRQGHAAVPVNVGATPERLAKGDVVARRDEHGQLMLIARAVTPTLLGVLRDAGERGENLPTLLAIAEWFRTQADAAQLRGRLVQSQLVRLRPDITPDVRIARTNLAHAYDRLGATSFNVLMDTLAWEIEPRGPDRRALFCGALRSLGTWLMAKRGL